MATFIKLRLRMMLRFFLEQKAACIIIAIIALLGVLYLSQYGPWMPLVIGVAIILTINGKRNDGGFLFQYFRQNRFWLMALDYALIALPFILWTILMHALTQLILLISVAMLAPLVPKTKSTFTMPTHPLFSAGSYDYKSSFRKYLIPYLLILALSAVGLYVENAGICYIASGIAAVINCFGLWTDWKPEYIFHYSNACRFVLLSIKFALINTLVSIGPFLAIMTACDWSNITFVVLASTYVSITALAVKIQFMRIFKSQIGPIGEIAMIMFFPVLCVASALKWPVLAADIATTAILGILNYNHQKMILK